MAGFVKHASVRWVHSLFMGLTQRVLTHHSLSASKKSGRWGSILAQCSSVIFINNLDKDMQGVCLNSVDGTKTVEGN